METKEFYIAGFKHHEGMSIIDDLSEDTKILLIPEPENPYDHNAIKIFAALDYGDFMLGYVPKAIAKDINASDITNAFISHVDPSAEPWLMVKVVVNF
jgi:hypothetical protein